MPYLACRARLAGPLLVLLCIAALRPSPLGAALGRWSPLGPEGGTAAAVVFAPSDPRVVYAALWGGGVFRSADGGVTWTAPGGQIAGQAVFSVAVDPLNAAIAYASGYGRVWKTVSGGAAWQAFPVHEVGSPILSLAIDPVRRQTLYAGSLRGVFRSDDAGRHWTRASQGLPADGQIVALTLDPRPPGRLFAAVQRYDGGTELFASADRGVTWAKVNSPEPAGIRQVSGFVWDRFSHTLYLIAWSSGGQGSGASLWKSSDDGATWSNLALPRLLINGAALAVDPSGVLYAGSAGVWKSTDGGAHWSEVGAIDSGGGIRFFAAVLSLAVDPGRAGRLLAGTFDLGIFESTGGAWRASNGGLTATDARGLEVVPAPRRKVLYAAVSGGGVFQSRDGGARWIPRNRGLEMEDAFYPYHPVGSLALDPKHPAELYAGVFRGAARSTDGAAHWTFHPTNDCTGTGILAVDPDSNTVYASSDSTSSGPCSLPCFTFVSRDDGRTWACLPPLYQANAIIIDPVNTAVVYFAHNQGVLKSTDRGASLVRADRGLAGRDVRSLAISPAAHRVVYAGTTQGLFKSTDAGRSWSPTGLSGVSVSALAVDPQDARHVYAGVAYSGVFESIDGGATWTPLNDGFPTAAFLGLLRLDSRTRTLYAGTNGSGLWAITLP